jgi:hypothetical protein
VNDTLLRALADARLDEPAVATTLNVDPKTVQRWVAGRVPQRRHRWSLADLLGRHELDLWPELGRQATHCPEIRSSYPDRGSVPRRTWHQLFAGAHDEIGILVYSGLFLAEDREAVGILADRARAGVRVRILLGDPDSPVIAARGTDEGIGDAMPAKVRNALVQYRPLLGIDGVEARLQLALPRRRSAACQHARAGGARGTRAGSLPSRPGRQRPDEHLPGLL